MDPFPGRSGAFNKFFVRRHSNEVCVLFLGGEPAAVRRLLLLHAVAQVGVHPAPIKSRRGCYSANENISRVVRTPERSTSST
jgi:hypothetical protein